jgi:TRAP-type mannitol/chloroaromatic compound transport system substrate-binding protein
VLELTVNKRAWDSLPADLQAIVTHAAESENMLMLSEMEQKNLTALKELRARPGVKIQRFPDDVLSKLKTLTDETLTEEAAANPKFKRVYEAYQDFRNQDDAWTAISEKAYLAID